MLNKPFTDALPIIEKLEKSGFQAFFVGGSVRDAMAGRQVGDIDITTSAKPDDVIRLFRKVIPVGIKHGTVIVRWRGESYEVTTFRTETGYTDFRRPDEVVFVNDVEKDLARRDFTMNAMAMDKSGKIIDPFGGETDIAEKRIKAVGEPMQRFEEDPLRMMRAVRFASQLDFSLESRTKVAISRRGDLLANISVERIAMEMEKLFAGKNVRKGLKLIKETGLHTSIPVIGDEPGLLEKMQKHAASFFTMEEVLAFFCILGAKTPPSGWMKEWKLSNRVKNNAEMLLEGYHLFQEKGLDHFLVYRLPDELAPGLFRLLAACSDVEVSLDDWKEISHSLPISGRKELAISGKDVMDVFPEKKKGGWIKKWIEEAEREVVNGSLPNDKRAIKEWLRHG